MGFKSYFTGKSGLIFWLNVLLMIVLLVGVPILGVTYLDTYTHKGEKIVVPSVVGKNFIEAEATLTSRGLVAVLTDSAYNENAAPGVILMQVPNADDTVKSGRLVYLTKNLDKEPLVKIPDLIRNSSLRDAETQLRILGFELLPNDTIEDEPENLVVGIRQNNRKLKSGDMVSKRHPLVICVGAGYDNDTIYSDNFVESDFY